MENKECIHCGKCTKNCMFLEKYKIDIGDMKNHEELLYHCFLCGKCTEVCPIGIDGREMILNMRRRQVKENGNKIKEKGYEMLIQEKQDYIFSNYKNQTKKSVLFPGCNFPSFYPKTTKYIIDWFRKEAGIGVVFDCCGKPIAELGLQKKEEEIVERIEKRLEEAGIEELIMLCPNCYHFLKPRLKIRVISIYEKLAELGVCTKLEGEIRIFPPCPDRESGEMLKDIKKFLVEEPEVIKSAQCCGLGGCAGGKESDLAEQMVKTMIMESEKKKEKIYTYCASCSGNFARKGYADAEHILLKILGRDEKPDIKKSIVNRAKMKYWKG